MEYRVTIRSAKGVMCIYRIEADSPATALRIAAKREEDRNA